MKLEGGDANNEAEEVGEGKEDEEEDEGERGGRERNGRALLCAAVGVFLCAVAAVFVNAEEGEEWNAVCKLEKRGGR